ncbi:hypothetical protein BH24ACT15_BH24ACT15_29850 [soil metagenome]
MPDRKALCLASGGLEEIGAADRLILPGDPDFDLHAAPKRYVDRLSWPHALAVGEEIYSRDSIAIATVPSTTQNVRLVYFTARKSETTTQVRVRGGNTAAAATPTRCEIALFEINAAGDGTRVAVTANDTSLFATTFTAYTRSWIASYSKIAGQRYALGWLVVTTVAAPTYTGANLAFAADDEFDSSPRFTGKLTGQTTMPSSFTAASVTGSNVRPYGVILP